MASGSQRKVTPILQILHNFSDFLNRQNKARPANPYISRVSGGEIFGDADGKVERKTHHLATPL